MRVPTSKSRLGYSRNRSLRIEHLESRSLLTSGDLDDSFGNAGVVDFT